MKVNLKIGMIVLILLAASPHAWGAVPGDLNGDNIVSQEELLIAENLANMGNITADQLEEIQHIHDDYPRTFIDNSGKSITINKPIRKIILLNADCAEVFRCLGIKNIIGVDSYIAKDSIFFPELSKLTEVGSSFHPDCEAILTLDPDIVIAYTGVKEEDLDDKIEAADIPIARFSACKVPTRDDQLRTLGYIFNEEDKAEELVKFYHNITDPIISTLKNASSAKKSKVYIECYSDFKARNGRSGTQEMCAMAGGMNIAEDLDLSGQGTTSQVDPEWIVAQNPDIIIKVVSGSEVSCGYDEDDTAEMMSLRDAIMNRPGFDNITAVKENRVYLITPDICDRSCNVIGVAYMAKWFHPDLFKDLDPQAIHQEYLTRFQGLDYDLSKHGVFVYPEES
ncbi:MAG: ABC transporter substrate-binding protein [Methanothrix sp.]|nr:ABC transporter substrate-binding protein [Methanothrix sp.]